MNMYNDYDKVKRVIKSCRSRNQLWAAYNLIRLFEKKWKPFSKKSENLEWLVFVLNVLFEQKNSSYNNKI